MARPPAIPIVHVGEQIGYWRVIYVPRLRVKILCQCQCLQIAEVSFYHLRHGGSSGCIQCRKLTAAYTHGHTGTPIYGVWDAMRPRCSHPKSTAWEHYGGRGITVCERWQQSFQNFLDDMGEKPTPDSTLERIDNNKGYSPDNCRWATKQEQLRNQRRTIFLTYRGKTQMLDEWAKETGISEITIRTRLKRHPNWPVEWVLAPLSHAPKRKQIACSVTLRTLDRLTEFSRKWPLLRLGEILDLLVEEAAQHYLPRPRVRSRKN